MPSRGGRRVLLVAALEIADDAGAVEVPHAGADFFQQVLVVGDQQDGALDTAAAPR